MFALALRLGLPVRVLLNSLDSAELTEWQAFFQLEREGAGADAPADDEQIANAFRMAFNA